MTMVEVVDPTHPLFGRRFPCARTSTPLTGPGFVWVVYRDFMQLRIPLGSTSLVPAHPRVRTTYTAQAIADLLALADAWGVGKQGKTYADGPARPLGAIACPPPPADQRGDDRDFPGGTA